MDVVRLVKQAKKGSKEALLQLILSEKDAYYKLAFTYMGNAPDAMDAMEDMIVRLYENIHRLQKDTAFYSWSKTILVNSCKSMLKKRNKLVLMEDWPDAHPKEPEPAFIGDPYKRSDEQMDIEAMFIHINEHQREAIQLKYIHDLDYQTIADMTQVSIGTVKSRIFQGLKKLRARYGGDSDE
ncbi:RNA polymerase sigma-70 factor, ECF subfamily [Paenibacillus sp. UNCCL117]|uniref:RNA polymerase sigma factor n=1 Tax=unclassified Paenibacillus TaxID=185978 RepID=UPI0008872D53|nr:MULTISPECIES: RNA polymerase sigma factor [unclassified Paenibacillus]SDC44481.1 RNA polymerase sigma-70 factor, ECF subfamily [Paenibacillus sp. cl123]SFW12725.1 RNA polymerase sigma-70 factor, ECF subfamily [Paenibacillus sp. UNCCL117]